MNLITQYFLKKKLSRRKREFQHTYLQYARKFQLDEPSAFLNFNDGSASEKEAFQIKNMGLIISCVNEYAASKCTQRRNVGMEDLKSFFFLELIGKFNYKKKLSLELICEHLDKLIATAEKSGAF